MRSQDRTSMSRSLRDRSRHRSRHRSRDRSRHRSRDRSRHRSRDRSRHRSRHRSRDRERSLDIEVRSCDRVYHVSGALYALNITSY